MKSTYCDAKDSSTNGADWCKDISEEPLVYNGEDDAGKVEFEEKGGTGIGDTGGGEWNGTAVEGLNGEEKTGGAGGVLN